MIEFDAVITTHNAFVVADKIDKMQWVKGFNENTVLEEVTDGEDAGFLVSTKHYSIIVSPHQKFLTAIVGMKYSTAKQLQRFDVVFTADGYQRIEEVTNTKMVYDMTNLRTRSGIYIANSFYLLSD